MAYVSMPPAERAQLDARIAQLDVGAELTVRFTSRGTRRARVARIAATGARYVETYSPSNNKWSAPRRLTADDLKLY